MYQHTVFPGRLLYEYVSFSAILDNDIQWIIPLQPSGGLAAVCLFCFQLASKSVKKSKSLFHFFYSQVHASSGLFELTAHRYIVHVCNNNSGKMMNFFASRLSI